LSNAGLENYRQSLRRGIFHSVPDLIASIEEYSTRTTTITPIYLDRHHRIVLAKVARGRVALEKIS